MFWGRLAIALGTPGHSIHIFLMLWPLARTITLIISHTAIDDDRISVVLVWFFRIKGETALLRPSGSETFNHG